MAEQEQIDLLKQGVDVWNAWRENNPAVVIDLSDTDLGGFDLSGVIFRYADLSAAYLCNTILIESDLSNATLVGATLRSAKLSYANLSDADLSDADIIGSHLAESKLIKANLTGSKIIGADLTSADLTNAELNSADLSYSDLTKANLFKANLSNASCVESKLINTDLCSSSLRGANLRAADLYEANLCGADLIQSVVLRTNFRHTNLTGICIQDWNINSETNFNDVVCDYIFLKWDQQERRPLNGNFGPGEFTALIGKTLETIDLIFVDGIDWQAFFQSIQQLRSQFGDQEIGIQAIEKKDGGAFVVRLEAPPEADKGAIESVQKELYNTQLQLREAHGELKVYREMSDVIKTLAGKPVETTQNFNAPVSNVTAHNEGEMNNEQITNQTTINAEKIENIHSGSGNINNYAVPEQQVLVEAVTEIQQHLQQLEQTNPTASESEQIQYVNIATKPEFKQRVVSAMQAGGEKALEEFVLENKYLKVIKATIKGWLTGKA